MAEHTCAAKLPHINENVGKIENDQGNTRDKVLHLERGQGRALKLCKGGLHTAQGMPGHYI